MTGFAPAGSVESGAEPVAAEDDSGAGLLAAGLDPSVGVLEGVGADGVVALLVQPAHKIAAARMSGSVRCFISEYLPRVIPYGEHHTAPMRDR